MEFTLLANNIPKQVKLIPYDTKLFAQADCEKSIDYFLSSDAESLKIFNLLNQEINLNFRFIDLNTPHNEVFGILLV